MAWDGARPLRQLLVSDPRRLRTSLGDHRRGRRLLSHGGIPGTRSGREGSIVLSHTLWKQQFSGSPTVLDTELRIGSRIYPVVGVTPKRFHGTGLAPVDVWLPLGAGDDLIGPGWRDSSGTKVLRLVARRGPHADDSAIGAEMGAIFRSVNEDDSLYSQADLELTPLMPLRGFGNTDVQVSIWIAGLAGALLVIACLSVSFVLLVWSARRRRNISIRACLGAGRFAGFRQTALECWLLVLLGAVLAVGITWIGTGPVADLLLSSDLAWDGGVSPRTLVYIAGLALVAGILASLLPVARALRIDTTLRPGAAPPSRLAGGRLRDILLAAQIAMTVVLLSGAALFSTSLREALAVDLGLDAGEVLLVTVDFKEAEIDPARAEAILQQVVARLGSRPDMKAAGLGAAVPFDSVFGVSVTYPGGEALPQLPGGGPYVDAVSPDYFRTLGISILRGRGFDEQPPGGEAVAVVNQSAAETYWPGEEPLGACLEFPDLRAGCTRVLGVVEDTNRQALTEEAAPQIYLPLDQRPEWMTTLALFVRPGSTIDAARDAAPLIRQELQTLEPALPFIEVRLVRDLIDHELRPWRAGAIGFATLGLLAFLVAVIGLVGTVATLVHQRRKEIGIRLALGASPSQLTRTLSSRGLWVALAGVVLGVLLSRLVSDRIVGVLFSTPTGLNYFATFLIPAVVFATVAFATLLPAVRARRIHPGEVLNEDAAR